MALAKLAATKKAAEYKLNLAGPAVYRYVTALCYQQKPLGNNMELPPYTAEHILLPSRNDVRFKLRHVDTLDTKEREEEVKTKFVPLGDEVATVDEIASTCIAGTYHLLLTQCEKMGDNKIATQIKSTNLEFDIALQAWCATTAVHAGYILLDFEQFTPQAPAVNKEDADDVAAVNDALGF